MPSVGCRPCQWLEITTAQQSAGRGSYERTVANQPLAGVWRHIVVSALTIVSVKISVEICDLPDALYFVCLGFHCYLQFTIYVVD